MRKLGVVLLLGMLGLSVAAQKKSKENNTLLWQISGNGLAKPSYLFGTIHMICKDDAVLSDSLKNAIKNSDDVYLEVDMDNLLEMVSVMTKIKMKGDTTLQDLLNKEDYELLKDYFEKKSSLLPFSELKKYKPLLASSLLMEQGSGCESSEAMEQVIMDEAKRNKKEIKGLETMAYQMSIFDSIPYKSQAETLVKFVKDERDGKTDAKIFETLTAAYKEQDLEKLEALTKSGDMGMANFEDVLLYNRNKNWVKKLKDLMMNKSLVVAVGAGHLPGDKGVINLLRQAGYTVKPIKNKINTDVKI